MIDVAVIGGSGYTGGELLRLLLRHPDVNLAAVASRRLAGKSLAEAFPWLHGLTTLNFVPPEEVIGHASASLVFTALGHMESVPLVGDLLAAGKKVVDLSADFRLKDPSLYDVWYNQKHPRPDLLEEAAYGLPERYRTAIAQARLCANPGCYATASILGLLPLAVRRLLPAGVVVDAKSGLSGAGRTPREDTVFPECHEGFRPYAVARHRHMPEITGVLKEASGAALELLFVPHLIPTNRGILATIYVKAPETAAAVRELYEEYYRREHFVIVNPPGRYPGIQDVRGSNYCRLGIEKDQKSDYLVIMSVIDNLVKGASGQAIQNMNIMLGLSESAGLTQCALSP